MSDNNVLESVWSSVLNMPRRASHGVGHARRYNSILVFPGYRSARRDRPVRTAGGGRGGGVCIVYRETLQVESLELPGAGTALESLWLSVRSVTTFVIGVMYRPPQRSCLSNPG